MHKTPQKTSPPISRFSPLQPMSQAGKIGYQAAMRQLGYNQPFRVASQPNLKGGVPIWGFFGPLPNLFIFGR